MKQFTSLSERPFVKRMLNVVRVVFFVFGVIATLSTCQLFKSCNDKSNKIDYAFTNTTLKPDLEDQGEALLSYRRHIVNLNKRNSELEKQIINAKRSLAQSTKENIILQKDLQRQIGNSITLTDTLQLLKNCDSLAISATELMITCLEKDSIYGSLTEVLTEQVALKDSIITVQNQQVDDVQLNFERSFAQKQLLIVENLGLRKEIKQHKVRSKILSAGLMILGGTIAYMALRH